MKSKNNVVLYILPILVALILSGCESQSSESSKISPTPIIESNSIDEKTQTNEETLSPTLNPSEASTSSIITSERLNDNIIRLDFGANWPFESGYDFLRETTIGVFVMFLLI